MPPRLSTAKRLIARSTSSPLPASRQSYHHACCRGPISASLPARSPPPSLSSPSPPARCRNNFIPFRCQQQQRRRWAHSQTPFESIVDSAPQPVRTGRQHGPGIIFLAIIPIAAFALGTWQVRRLAWKTELIARYEDRLARPPLPLPPQIDVDAAAADFDFRRVRATGRFRHDQEMLLGPRVYDGKNGFQVITPLERTATPLPPLPSSPASPRAAGAAAETADDKDDGAAADGSVQAYASAADTQPEAAVPASSVLVNRGWIPQRFRRQADRAGDEALPRGEVTVEGLLRKPWRKNMFTPDNRPERGEFYFPDVQQMAALTGCQPVWIEETLEPELLKIWDRQAKGVPIGRPPEVGLRNNHAQYIFTWYALSLATAYMLYLVVRRPPSDIARRVRQNKEWA